MHLLHNNHLEEGLSRKDNGQVKLRFEAWNDLVLRIFYKRYLLDHIKTRQVIENEHIYWIIF